MNFTKYFIRHLERQITLNIPKQSRQIHQKTISSNGCSCLTNTKQQRMTTTPWNSISKSPVMVYTTTTTTTRRTFHVSSVNNNDEDSERKIQTKIITMQSPFKYISLKIKVFLMRAYFDQEFDEKMFMSGAKQGVVFVSTHLSEGKFTELSDVLTQEGLQAGRELYFQNDRKPASLRVDESDFLQMAMSDIGFEYGEGGRKWAFVLVTCFCTAKEAVSKTFGNIDVIATPTRILKYSFRREYTPGITAGWLIDSLEHSNTPL